MIPRRSFLQWSAAGAVATLGLTGPGSRLNAAPSAQAIEVMPPREGEDLFAYMDRLYEGFRPAVYKQLLGAANEFKEGDQILGLAARDDQSRRRARALLANTRIQDLDAHPPLDDELHRFCARSIDTRQAARLNPLTIEGFKSFLLRAEGDEIHERMLGMSSTAIGCVVKLMSNAELIAIGQKVFNPLPGSRVGGPGYLGARIQPNSPTDHVDDIRWQVFNGFSFAVGDVLLGSNPVSSDPRSVHAVEKTLQDVLATFQLTDTLPHCVLSHIDVQAEVEERWPGSTALWFQSIAGSDDANATFDITVRKMQEYAARRTGKYGLYFETGQGADFTNGHGHGFDMVLHESRKYGFARALTREVAEAQRTAQFDGQPWVHLNDVAGFIGPEVFRSREQLVRCCLEDIVMGKLHGLCLGLDVCSTLHMDVSLDDLDWCLDQIMPANPAYLMALPTKIDPMLGYLTTGFQDHVRIREKFGYKVDDAMWAFFQQLGVIDAAGQPTEHFGDPDWVYLQYCRRKGDARSDDAIRSEGRQQLDQISERGVFIAEGHGERPWDLAPKLEQDIRRIYADAKESIWAELPPAFIAEVPAVRRVFTRSTDRQDYILHPESGEQLSSASQQDLQELCEQRDGRYNVQIVVSDGLNALAITDPGHLHPFLTILRQALLRSGYKTAPENLVITSGRVRAGYRIGETLYQRTDGSRSILHIIGERPGTGHHTFSIYITRTDGETWSRRGAVDHNITKVVSGVASTALAPAKGAEETVRILNS